MFYQLLPSESLVHSLPEKRKEQVYHFPHVTIFMPFNTRLQDKKRIEESLSIAVEEVSAELAKRFPGEMGELVEQKLKNTIRNLNYNIPRKSVAIFISPVFERVLYLNFEMRVKVSVGGHFQIRDIVQSRKSTPRYHILTLNENGGRIFLNDDTSSIIIPVEDVNHRELTQSFGGFQLTGGKNLNDSVSHNMDFFYRTNNALNSLLATQRLPVFVMGNKKLLNHFRKIFHPQEAIAGWVNGDINGLSLTELKDKLRMYLQDWELLKQKHQLHLLDVASNQNRLVTGFRAVRNNIMKHRGKTLMVGKRYLYSQDWQDMDERMGRKLKFNKFSYLKNTMDELIEKIIEDGGDVEMVSDNVLENYSQIALITG